MRFKTLHYDLSVLQINENTCKIKFNTNLFIYSIEMYTILGIKEYTPIRGHQSSHFKIKHLGQPKNYPHTCTCIHLKECISRVWGTLLHTHTNDTHTLLVPYHKQYMAVLAPSLVCIMGTRCSLMDSIISYNNEKISQVWDFSEIKR